MPREIVNVSVLTGHHEAHRYDLNPPTRFSGPTALAAIGRRVTCPAGPVTGLANFVALRALEPRRESDGDKPTGIILVLFRISRLKNRWEPESADLQLLLQAPFCYRLSVCEARRRKFLIPCFKSRNDARHGSSGRPEIDYCSGSECRNERGPPEFSEVILGHYI